jgi:hypothetical protein
VDDQQAIGAVPEPHWWLKALLMLNDLQIG